ncbi:two-component regulator propeller domain-containing protein [Dyadobacter sp. LHD-138]|uniref:hybrid sensor histidine kinase/response regulator transcription factor n=1 Tax=Dyadobacter sp. LHD-138 TaxID=3071413 RepID=UPI0027DFB47B|nr:two-component regulator propeller domain-containing protein [Dyadobacter sp. LHD-138]MDQ6482136.1 two-component regulator propeller domain-containing protein [Dyadobacter sp. LHD-138]
MNRRKSVLICLIFTLVSVLKIYGQSFKNFTEIDSEPIGAVLGITQDKNGLMWFGSTAGLIRYDSRTFRCYRNDKKGNPILADIRDVLCDSKGNIWAATASGLTHYDLNNASLTHFEYDSVQINSLSNNYINCVIEDSKKQIWLGTQHGLTQIVSEHGKIKIWRHLQTEFKDGALNAKCLIEGKDGNLWVGTANGLIKLKGKEGKPELYRMPASKHETLKNEIRAIYQDEKGVIWLGSGASELVRFDPVTEEFSVIKNFKSPSGDFPVVTKIISDGRSKLLLATSSGLAHFDPLTGYTDWYVNRPGDPYSLPTNSLWSVYRDKQGGLWLGSYYEGISYFNFDAPRIKRWPFTSEDSRGKYFRNGWMGKSKSNFIWSISDKLDKLLIFDTNGKNPSSYPLKLSTQADYYSFYLDENKVLWAGGNTVLTSYDVARGVYRDYPFNKSEQEKPVKGRTYILTEDSYGRFWVGGSYGLLLFDKLKGTVTKDPTVTYAATIYEDSQHNIWIGGHKGLYRIKSGSHSSHAPLVEKVQSQSDLLMAWRIHEDMYGKIWAACHTRLLFYNPKTNQFELNTDVPQEAVLDIVPDTKGYLWINASSKLYRYHPKNRTLQSYGYQDGLPAKGTLRQGAGMIDKNGSLYFVSDEGMFTFDPTAISVGNHASPIVLSAMKLYNKEVKTGDSTGILREPLSKTKEITFTHEQSIFTLDFALLDYARSNLNKYAYKIDGIDKDWNYVQTPSATYTNLPAGTYIFQAKAANGDGVWMKKHLSVKITILPPWWRTWYAYLFYMLLTALVTYGITRFFWIRSSFRRENALNQIKLDFFTNVSHEIRTHLSLISGPLEKAFQQSVEGKNNEKFLGYARNSSDKLLLLVNELLDFRKIQSGSLRLQVRKHDVVKIVKTVIAAFEHSANEKDIETTFVSPETPVMLWFDIAQMQKVFYNLLSNAYKFTPEGGKVVVSVTEISNEVIISVADNGKGISHEHLQKLFTYYYQADSEKPGYGIGLALSNSIVKEHHGHLTTESHLAKDSSSGGTKLTIRMPRKNGHFSADQIASKNGGYFDKMLAETMMMPDANSVPHTKQTNTILIIEDNDQLRVFLRELFEGEFKTLEAENGLRGLALADEHIPDIILSDVMMPEMNGLEVCNRLKSNVTTAHIPIVLLTARTQNEQIIEGLSSGADDYLIKPFDPRILELKINNLIRVRDEMRTRYRQSVFAEEGSENSIAQDFNEEFIAKLRAIVIENISDSGFGVNELAFQIGMSVSVLYRKMRSLTGMTVNEFVKTIRLTEAKKLLEAGIYQVSEVATIIGFEDSKYFSKEFRKVFGKTPIEIRRQVTQ